MRFEVCKHTNYDNGINIGHVVVYMRSGNRQRMIDCLYKVKNDEWNFYYENNSSLTDNEKAEFENWFIACG